MSFYTLDEIAALADDWDGQGATAPSRDTVARARIVNDILTTNGFAPLYFRPSPDGAICFEVEVSSIT